MKIAFRLYKRGKLIHYEQRDIPDDVEADLMQSIATEHMHKLLDGPHMVEIEFVDDAPNPERFFRFGTDPNGMVEPMQIELTPKEPGA